MQGLSDDEKKRIIAALNAKGAVSPCPRCGKQNFVMADGYFNRAMQDNFSSITLGGPSIPTLAVVCSNCGWVAEHALGVLGLLPERKSESNG